MLLETNLQSRLLGITPSYEQQLHYATIFRSSPDLAFSTAYIDGWLAASRIYIKALEKKYECNSQESN